MTREQSILSKRPRHRRNNNTERTARGKQLSPLGGCPIPRPKGNGSGGSLRTSLSHSLASTSRADRVNLYGFKINGIDPYLS
jgi:hypothetical protein